MCHKYSTPNTQTNRFSENNHAASPCTSVWLLRESLIVRGFEEHSVCGSAPHLRDFRSNLSGACSSISLSTLSILVQDCLGDREKAGRQPNLSGIQTIISQAGCHTQGGTGASMTPRSHNPFCCFTPFRHKRNLWELVFLFFCLNKLLHLKPPFLWTTTHHWGFVAQPTGMFQVGDPDTSSALHGAQNSYKTNYHLNLSNFRV